MKKMLQTVSNRVCTSPLSSEFCHCGQLYPPGGKTNHQSEVQYVCKVKTVIIISQKWRRLEEILERQQGQAHVSLIAIEQFSTITITVALSHAHFERYNS